ncbi:MAG: hypothetical protein HZA52_12835 [Planctomycetes bacterium]|nr:hypothetical protein [Planctomycetota bacterium]
MNASNDALHRWMTFQNGAADAAGSLASLCGAALVAGWGATRVFRFQ